MGFLGEVQRANERMERAVEIDVENIEEVLLVDRAEGEEGRVGRRHRVHECGERSAQHLEEGIAHRGELFAATENRVFEDVRCATVVFRRSAESDATRLFAARERRRRRRRSRGRRSFVAV